MTEKGSTATVLFSVTSISFGRNEISGASPIARITESAEIVNSEPVMGFGDLLAEGMTRLALKWEVSDQPYHLAVKGLELPMHDPRVKVGVGIGYATCPYGADHMNAPHDTLFFDEKFSSFQSVKPLGIYNPIHPTQITNEKVRSYVLLDYLWKMMDALGLCVFGFAPRGVMPLDLMIRCLNAVTGWNASLFELMNSSSTTTCAGLLRLSIFPQIPAISIFIDLIINKLPFSLKVH
jgi:aldehyde:ferredoxin oxidoreductase